MTDDLSACPVAHDYDPLAPSTLRDPYPVLTGCESRSGLLPARSSTTTS